MFINIAFALVFYGRISADIGGYCRINRSDTRQVEFVAPATKTMRRSRHSEGKTIFNLANRWSELAVGFGLFVIHGGSYARTPRRVATARVVGFLSPKIYPGSTHSNHRHW